MRIALLIAVVLAVVLLGSVASANLLSNGSFEGNYSGDFQTLYTGSMAIPSWTVTAGSIDWINTYWQPQDGSNSLDLSGDSGKPGTIAQTFGTVSGQAYLVSFWVAGNPYGLGSVVKAGVTTGAGPDYNWQFDVTGHSMPDMGWEQRSFTFYANAPSTTLSFASLEASACGPALDNVSVTAVPEPGTIIAVCGLLAPAGLMFRRRRKA